MNRNNGRPIRPELFYGGETVGKVYSYDRGRREADAVAGGTPRKMPLDRVTGRLRVPGRARRELSAAEVAAELERRAGIAFGTAPAADAEPGAEAA